MLRTKKENQLFYWGAGIFFCTLIIYSIISHYFPEKLEAPNRFGNFDNLILIIIFTLIVAPIMEESVFRGIFTKNKMFTFCFYIGILIMTIITKNYYVILFVLIIFLIQKRKKSFHINVIYILNSFLFALIHYKLTDFTNVFSIIPVFFQFSLGLIFIWVTINFKLIWSMVLHFFINAIIIIPLFLLLQFPNTQRNILSADEIEFMWEKTSALGKSKSIYTPNEVRAERITIEQFITIFNSKKTNIKINDSLRYYRYNFIIKDLKDEKLETDDVKRILLKSQLIEK